MNSNQFAEQFLAAQKTQMSTLFDLAQKSFEGVEKLVGLNMQVAKASLNDAAEQSRTLLEVRDLQALQSSLQPSTEKFAAYCRQVHEIVSATQAEFGRVAEAKMAGAQQEFLTALDVLAKNAPAGSENIVAMMKSAVSTASSAMESVQKASQQATDLTQANIQALTAKRRAA